MRLDFTLLALIAPLAVLGDLRHSHRKIHNHSEIAKRAEGHIQLHKRFNSARWTFYDVGGAAGACGQVNSQDQHTVALNSAQYGGGYPGPNCFKIIVMQIGDKQTTATITDECPGCPYGGLDLTRGLFQFFAPLGEGVLTGNWWFQDEAPPAPKPDPKPTTSAQPKPSPTPTPETTKAVTHKTSSTSDEGPASTSSSSSSSHHSSSHSSSAVSSSASSSFSLSSAVTSGLAVPTAVASANTDNGQNILSCNQALIGLGALAAAGAEA